MLIHRCRCKDKSFPIVSDDDGALVSFSNSTVKQEGCVFQGSQQRGQQGAHEGVCRASGLELGSALNTAAEAQPASS